MPESNLNLLEDAATGNREMPQKGSNGAAHVSGLYSKLVDQPAGTYNATDILGLNIVKVGTAGNWVLTAKNGGVATILFSDMVKGIDPGNLSSITVPTGGQAILYIPS